MRQKPWVTGAGAGSEAETTASATAAAVEGDSRTAAASAAMIGPANSTDAEAATAASARETCDERGRGSGAGETQGGVVNFDDDDAAAACVVVVTVVVVVCGLTAAAFAITPLLLAGSDGAPARDADACIAEAERMLGAVKMEKKRKRARARERRRDALSRKVCQIPPTSTAKEKFSLHPPLALTFRFFFSSLPLSSKRNTHTHTHTNPSMADPELSAPVAKALARLQQALDAGTAYEGQQVAKAAAARMRSRGSKEEAADLLGRAAEAQIRAGQVILGGREVSLSALGKETEKKTRVERERGEANRRDSDRWRKPMRSIVVGRSEKNSTSFFLFTSLNNI